MCNCHEDFHLLGVHAPKSAAEVSKVGEPASAAPHAGDGPTPRAPNATAPTPGPSPVFAPSLTRWSWLLLGLWFGVPLALCAGWAWGVSR